jgi:hypothetical protein
MSIETADVCEKCQTPLVVAEGVTLYDATGKPKTTGTLMICPRCRPEDMELFRRRVKVGISNPARTADANNCAADANKS